MLKSIALSVFSLFVIATPVMAVECPPDHPAYEDVLKVVEGIVKDQPEFRSGVLDDALEISRILPIINAIPPETEYKADHIIMLWEPGDPEANYRIGLSYQGCLVTGFAVPGRQWRFIMDKAFGSGS